MKTKGEPLIVRRRRPLYAGALKVSSPYRFSLFKRLRAESPSERGAVMSIGAVEQHGLLRKALLAPRSRARERMRV